MMKSLMKIATVASLLLVTVTAPAAQPDPTNCPCYDPLMLNAAASTSCTSEVSFNQRHGSKKGAYQIDFVWLQNPGEYCGKIILRQYDPTSTADPRECLVIPGQYNSGVCSGQSLSGHAGLTNEQMKDCEAALKEITIYIKTLPDC